MDIWIWNGRYALPAFPAQSGLLGKKNQLKSVLCRPNWADIFLSVKQQREPDVRKIGCCFCGTPVIGKDLKRFCIENSSLNEGIAFMLHKENF